MDSNFTFQVSHRRSNFEPYEYIQVTVTDEVSGEVLFDGPFTDAQFRQLLSPGQVHVTGFVSDDLQRVGKEMRTEMTQVPDEVTDGVAYAKRELVAKVWAENECERLGMETVRVDSTNRGFRAVFHAWGPAPEPEVSLTKQLASLDEPGTSRRVEVPAMLALGRTRDATRHATVAWATKWMASNGYESFAPVADKAGRITHVDFRK